MSIMTIIGALGALILLGVISVRKPTPQTPPTGGSGDNDVQVPSQPGNVDMVDRIINVIARANPAIPESERRTIAEKMVYFAGEAQVDPLLVCAIVWHESNFVKTARGSSGEYGLMQIMPGTFEQVLRVYSHVPRLPIDTLLQIGYNLQVGTLYLRWIYNRLEKDLQYALKRPEFQGDNTKAALYIYNAGTRFGLKQGIQYQAAVLAKLQEYA